MIFSELTEIHRAANKVHTICILSVPATMTCHDLLTFTAACHQDIQHFRIIQDNNPNQYMALITVRSSVSTHKENNVLKQLILLLSSYLLHLLGSCSSILRNIQWCSL